MAKDPAFLFYYEKWLVGTSMMTHELKGIYIDLLAHMADKGGRLSNDEIKNIMGRKHAVKWKYIESKFIYKENYWYNERLSEVLLNRALYAESRRINRSKSSKQFPPTEDML